MRYRPVVALLLSAVQVAACGSSVSPAAHTPTDAPSVPPQATANPSPVGTVEPSATASAKSFAVPAGAFVIVDVVRSGDEYLALVRTAADAGSGVTSTDAVAFALPDRWTVDSDEADVRLSDDGYLAVALRPVNEDELGRATAVIPLSTAHAGDVVVVDGAGPAWVGDRDDTLLTLGHDDTEQSVIHRWPNHGETAGADLTLPAGVFPAADHGHPVVDIVRDGLWTVRDDIDPLKHHAEVLRFDGTFEPRDPVDTPVFVTGLERDRLVDGSTTSQWCDDSPLGGECGTTLIRPDGTEVRLRVPKHASVTGDSDVDRSGTRLVAISNGRLLVYADRDGELVVEQNQRLPGAGSREWNEIVGISDDEFAISRFGEVVLIDDAGASDPIPGVLAYIGR